MAAPLHQDLPYAATAEEQMGTVLAGRSCGESCVPALVGGGYCVSWPLPCPFLFLFSFFFLQGFSTEYCVWFVAGVRWGCNCSLQ